jgi:pimeloyl-ACP methyl ester carboxylesterase
VGNRDLILLDQRGTGYSQPSLTCPEFTALKYRTLDQNLSDAAGTALELQAARQCRARLVKQHVDLSGYTTLADAADVQDLRRALGYAQVDLYGVSYGTRLALAIMRAFPVGIRSVVLDSVVPAQTDLFSSPPASLNRVLNVLFQGCSIAATCNAAYPHLATTFYTLVQRLNAHPLTQVVRVADTGKSYKVLVTGDMVVDITFNTFYQTQLIPALPQMIAEAARGNYTYLTRLAGLVEFQFDTGISQGMYYSVECGEDAPFTTARQVTAVVQQLPPALRSFALSSSLPDLQVCALWGVKKASPGQRAPVTSALPTLVLSGEYDPITPPSSGALAASTLSNSFAFSFPGTGHGVFLTNRCPYRITQDFLNDPTTRPVADCIASMAEPAFAVPSPNP